MQRRHALITSAVASVVVLGGAVSAAAWSGTGVLGFGHNGSSVSSEQSPGVVVVGDSSTSDSAPTQTPGTTVQVRVVEDRIVVRSGGSAAGGEAAPGHLSVAGTGGSETDLAPVEVPDTVAPTTAAPPPSTTRTTVRARHHDDDDEREHDDEHEYEHEEGDDD